MFRRHTTDTLRALRAPAAEREASRLRVIVVLDNVRSASVKYLVVSPKDRPLQIESKNNVPPKKRPKRPSHVRTDAEWDVLRRAAETWVTESRSPFDPWDKGDVAKANAIGGRVYHESYPGDWVSYQLAARAKGIRGYQFRAPGEWFAELYAAYHSGKLSPKHAAAGWLEKLKVESESG